MLLLVTLNMFFPYVIFDLVQATEKLMDTVKNGAPTERWIAVQCLGEHDYHDDCVINELISYVNGGDMIKSKITSELLKKLSCFTVSTHFCFLFLFLLFILFCFFKKLANGGVCIRLLQRYQQTPMLKSSIFGFTLHFFC